MNSESSVLGVTALVMDHDSVRLIHPLNDVDSLALQGCAAEDPTNWNDIVLVWPRYKFHPENTVSPEQFPIADVDLSQGVNRLNSAPAWLVIDLVQRRVLTGGEFPLLRLRRDPIDDTGPRAQTTVLPPWWELHQRTTVSAVLSPRQTQLAVGHPRRDVLWGSAMTTFFARRMVELIHSGESWIDSDWEGEPCGNRKLTVSVHRDWLMTPHPRLSGGIPRDCLHIAKDWISDLVDGQTFRVYRDEAPVPISEELSNFESAAMGRHEVIMYFEACREALAAGWSWLLEDPGRLENDRIVENLASAMEEFVAEWLSDSFEGGESPDQIIQHERLRIPLISRGGHLIDCDCPICHMMADGALGPSICGFDGHALDVDDEFAFSIHASHEDWEEQQREFAEMDARVRADMERSKKDGEVDEAPFGSPWKNSYVGDEGTKGKFGQLSMAFQLAEIVDWLKSADAPQHDVDQLNAAFQDFRHSSEATEFKRVLEELATRYPQLVGRSADLQSRVDEVLRMPEQDEDSFDVPF
jgi:hypothetical protein